MGSTHWSDDHYRSRATHRKVTGAKTFEYDDKVRTGKVAAKVHETLDPKNMKCGVREARDSEEHPESNPVFVGLDVTGSMGRVPRMIQEKLPSLMGLLLRKGYLTDPAICVAAIGDNRMRDKAPLQVGQFESGIEIENDITNLYLEGGGGGNRCESYELALYFLARHTACDAFEKRSKKGYAFIICDEGLEAEVRSQDVEEVFGCGFEGGSIPIKQIIDEVHEKWELYCIVPKMTNWFDDQQIKDRWREVIGTERVLLLDNPDGISEMIASTIGVLEESVDIGDLVTDLTSEGATGEVAESVSRALATVGSGAGSLGKVTGAGTGLGTL